MSDRGQTRRWLATYGLLIAALVIECVVFEAASRGLGRPTFLSWGSFVNVLNRATVNGILAVGMTYVIISGGIDLSVGSLISLAGVICALIVKSAGQPAEWTEWTTWTGVWLLGAGWLAALAAGAVSGSVAGLFITRFQIPPFIATLALMSSLRGLGYIISGGEPISNLPAAYTTIGRYWMGGIFPLAAFLMLLCFGAGAVVLEETRFGRHVRAIGGNEESARLSGVRVGQVKWGVYCICAVLAALGGVITSSKLGSGAPTTGQGAELDVIASVVVGGVSLSGGRGTMGGTFLGLLIVSVLGSGLNWVGVETFGQQVILGVVILAAVLLDRVKRAA
ncbi:MAG: ABC transporter permease [Candidatus Hydrogenedentes bacterium]|nr:ABC transporter permease [Candidatus Hydrogenedentota bacterium]